MFGAKYRQNQVFTSISKIHVFKVNLYAESHIFCFGAKYRQNQVFTSISITLFKVHVSMAKSHILTFWREKCPKSGFYFNKYNLIQQSTNICS